MTLQKQEHPAAFAELRDAADWYEDQEPGLGEDFLDAVDSAVRQAAQWPGSAPKMRNWDRDPEIRSMRVQVFPYRVLYCATETSLIVLAYAHIRRRPGYWHPRIAH